MPASPYRTAGVAALAAAAAYLVQPAMVATFSGDEARMGTAAYATENTWQGAAGGAVFAAVGIALAITVRAIAAATGKDGVGVWLGQVSAAAWLAVGGISIAQYSSVFTGLADVTGDPALQRAVANGVDVVTTGFVGVAAIGFAGWVIGLAGSLGRVLAIAGGVAAVVTIVPILIWSQPWGVMISIPYLLLLGGICLARARKPLAVR